MKQKADNRQLYGRGYNRNGAVVATSIVFYTKSVADASEQATKMVNSGIYSRVDVVLGTQTMAIIHPQTKSTNQGDVA